MLKSVCPEKLHYYFFWEMCTLTKKNRNNNKGDYQKDSLR
jgi:hypothetical protein